MGNKNQTLIYFHFYDLSEGVDYRLLLNCSDDDWKEWEESDIQIAESFIGKMEAEYGVHDVMDSYKHQPEYILVGYCSYEVKKEKMNEFLEKWREKMHGMNWIHPNEQFQRIKISQKAL